LSALSSVGSSGSGMLRRRGVSASMPRASAKASASKSLTVHSQARRRLVTPSTSRSHWPSDGGREAAEIVGPRSQGNELLATSGPSRRARSSTFVGAFHFRTRAAEPDGALGGGRALLGEIAKRTAKRRAAVRRNGRRVGATRDALRACSVIRRNDRPSTRLSFLSCRSSAARVSYRASLRAQFVGVTWYVALECG
jgi:hypothetical protein